MATYADLSLPIRLFMNGFGFARFAVRDNPVVELAKPLDQCKFALVTTAGLRLETDAPFDRSIKLGDTSFRKIPGGVDVQSLTEDHKSNSFDHAGIEADKNLALPLDRFRELVEKKRIGALNNKHFSFMGSIIAPKKLIEKSAPRVAEELKKDRVDAVFLTPV